jgi:peptide deformylase
LENSQNTEIDLSAHNLVYVPHTALETAVRPLTIDNEDYKNALSKHMFEVMNRHKGVGLAANQINLDAAVFVMKFQGHPLFAINPIIEDTSDERVLMTEGCLSDPGLYLKIKRPANIRASWETIEGERVAHDLDGLDARVFLHEFDHLQGVLFTDRVSKLKLDMGRKKQEKRLQTFIT